MLGTPSLDAPPVEGLCVDYFSGRTMMSKTDKTAPYFRAVIPRGECPRKCGGGYPCKHFSSSKALGVIKRKMTRSERTRVRAAISQGVDPPVDQHKHRALWDVA